MKTKIHSDQFFKRNIKDSVYILIKPAATKNEVEVVPDPRRE